jgi:hypothetical protein
MISESERIDRYLAAQARLDALRAWRRPGPLLIVQPEIGGSTLSAVA